MTHSVKSDSGIAVRDTLKASPVPTDVDSVRPSVLIVDRSSESIEVLQAILRYRGVSSIGARELDTGLELARQPSLRVIVLDEDSIPEGRDRVGDDYVSATDNKNANWVFLGKLPNATKPAYSEIIAKPYHYADLIRRIEGLLVAETNSLGANRAA